MTITPELIRGFHRALYVACGLGAMNPNRGDERVWWDFLSEMTPLEEPELGGRLTVDDIQGVIGEMKRQNKAGQAQWALRPAKILRSPEDFRDMVLMDRKRRNARPIRPATVIQEQQVGDARRQVEVAVENAPVPVGELLDMFKKYRTR